MCNFVIIIILVVGIVFGTWWTFWIEPKDSFGLGMNKDNKGG